MRTPSHTKCIFTYLCVWVCERVWRWIGLENETVLVCVQQRVCELTRSRTRDLSVMIGKVFLSASLEFGLMTLPCVCVYAQVHQFSFFSFLLVFGRKEDGRQPMSLQWYVWECDRVQITNARARSITHTHTSTEGPRTLSDNMLMALWLRFHLALTIAFDKNVLTLAHRHVDCDRCKEDEIIFFVPLPRDSWNNARQQLQQMMKSVTIRRPITICTVQKWWPLLKRHGAMGKYHFFHVSHSFYRHAPYDTHSFYLLLYYYCYSDRCPTRVRRSVC